MSGLDPESKESTGRSLAETLVAVVFGEGSAEVDVPEAETDVPLDAVEGDEEFNDGVRGAAPFDIDELSMKCKVMENISLSGMVVLLMALFAVLLSTIHPFSSVAASAFFSGLDGRVFSLESSKE